MGTARSPVRMLFRFTTRITGVGVHRDLDSHLKSSIFFFFYGCTLDQIFEEARPLTTKKAATFHPTNFSELV
jgi:hypothetical protein